MKPGSMAGVLSVTTRGVESVAAMPHHTHSIDRQDGATGSKTASTCDRHHEMSDFSRHCEPAYVP
jgi:hypothetical protein